MFSTLAVHIILVPQGDVTELTWKMEGANGFLGKAMCMFMDMDLLIGNKFDEGLANLKRLVEKQAATPVATAP